MVVLQNPFRVLSCAAKLRVEVRPEQQIRLLQPFQTLCHPVRRRRFHLRPLGVPTDQSITVYSERLLIVS